MVVLLTDNIRILGFEQIAPPNICPLEGEKHEQAVIVRLDSDSQKHANDCAILVITYFSPLDPNNY